MDKPEVRNAALARRAEQMGQSQAPASLYSTGTCHAARVAAENISPPAPFIGTTAFVVAAVDGNAVRVLYNTVFGDEIKEEGQPIPEGVFRNTEQEAIDLFIDGIRDRTIDGGYIYWRRLPEMIFSPTHGVYVVTARMAISDIPPFVFHPE